MDRSVIEDVEKEIQRMIELSQYPNGETLVREHAQTLSTRIVQKCISTVLLARKRELCVESSTESAPPPVAVSGGIQTAEASHMFNQISQT